MVKLEIGPWPIEFCCCCQLVKWFKVAKRAKQIISTFGKMFKLLVVKYKCKVHELDNGNMACVN